MPDETDLSRARASLERIQNFDTSELRRDELGEPFNFEDAVQHADRLIGRFKQIPMDSLREFSDHQLSEIRHQADSVLELFEKVLRFNATRNNATGDNGTLLTESPTPTTRPSTSLCRLFPTAWQEPLTFSTLKQRVERLSRELETKQRLSNPKFPTFWRKSEERRRSKGLANKRTTSPKKQSATTPKRERGNLALENGLAP